MNFDSPLYIFDLDGTLADATHRIHLIQGETKDWRAFFAACAMDKPIREMIGMYRALAVSGAEAWIWTGRSDEVRRETHRWLNAFGVHPSHHHDGFRMRPAGDHRPDHEVKKEWLDQLAEADRDRLKLVFEDRDQVVAMYRAAGVQCCQVAPGNF